jgi:putative DNA primase/helicase
MKQLPQDAKELALYHWPLILEDAGVDAGFLRNIHGPCPLCGGSDRYRFDDKEGKGTYFCNHCGAGDGFKLLMGHLGLTFAGAADHIRKYFGKEEVQRKIINHAPAIKAEEDIAHVRAKLQECWDKAKPIKKGDPVWKYLVQTRQLPDDIPAVLRYHPRASYWEKGEGEHAVFVGTFPMMIAKVQGPDGKPVSIHRTYLTEKGEKAPVKKTKKLMKGLGISGGAIRLFPATDVLAVAEGIETALAVHAVTGQPCWATISSTVMMKLEVPESVKTVYIYADNDAPDEKERRAGQDAAKALEERLRSQGITVRIVLPINADTDIYDVWIQRLESKKRRSEEKAMAKARKVA